MRSHSYINTAQTILSQYDGIHPFANWLKLFFKGQKKYGSKDRREIGNLCYSYFRLGKAFRDRSMEEQLLLGLFLSGTESSFILSELQPEWNLRIKMTTKEKLNYLGGDEFLENLLPFGALLGGAIDVKDFATSFLMQPSLFIRIRPGNKAVVIKKLQKAALDFKLIRDNCIELENGIKIEDILEVDKEVVIQDDSSQRIIEPLSDVLPADDLLETWDCCAASGGKSILLKDAFPKAFLTVSDIRPSILHNLRNRFQRAGIKHYLSMVADLTKPDFALDKTFDVILCDAPCSGSGTWSRTPEQLFYFDEERIHYYSNLQKKIAETASWLLKPGGYFLYSTCSVFRTENEDVVSFIESTTQLKLVKTNYYKGYQHRADTLFAALFRLG
jgi:16S rRNA (cytosine967-C5)-methyltransferase